jgi:Putative transposase
MDTENTNFPPRRGTWPAKLKWLEKQKSELLPVGYFHLVFTLPHELNGLILTNKKILLSHLFKAVGETLVDFGRTRLGGQIGFITVLHTWDQTLLDHFHLHCLVPAGALSHDQKRWSPARKNFLFPVTALSLVFCGQFLDWLKKAFAQNKLLFVGQTASLANPAAFQLLINALRKKPWVVYAKNPFGSPVLVLDYLGRYTHRVALSNERILSAHNAEVSFSYRDRKDQNRKKTMTLDAHEFIRRFLLHVIPQKLRARASLRFFGQPIQRPSLKVPPTPGPWSRSAQAPLQISPRADAPTHRHRYHSMPPVPKGNSSLPCQPARLCTMGFFVMIAQRPKIHVFAALCAKASASVRPVLSLHPFLPRSRLCFATRSRPILASKIARPCQNPLRCYVCSARCRYNPHR